jgi:hypothetical protein
MRHYAVCSCEGYRESPTTREGGGDAAAKRRLGRRGPSRTATIVIVMHTSEIEACTSGRGTPDLGRAARGPPCRAQAGVTRYRHGVHPESQPCRRRLHHRPLDGCCRRGEPPAAVAAPWPMPVAAVTAPAMARHREPSARPGVVCAAIGLGCIVGTFIGPVTRRPRSWPAATRLAIGVNLAASAALVRAGAWHAAAARRRHPERGRRYREWGAKRGANIGRCLATSGDNQP